jgi:hypothetical protein
LILGRIVLGLQRAYPRTHSPLAISRGSSISRWALAAVLGQYRIGSWCWSPTPWAVHGAPPSLGIRFVPRTHR